ncbi:MAG: hypothetical protein ACI3ZQ_10430 [Candidatus Cryptobacteroides sp.]
MHSLATSREPSKLKAGFIGSKYDANSVGVKVTVNGRTRKLKADIRRKAD